MEVIGLRYFNVFGQRQDPEGAYAAVIPKWVGNLLHNEPCVINGDGQTSRDFCYIENAVQANLLAATVENEDALDQLYNIAYGSSTTLNQLYVLIRDNLVRMRPELSVLDLEPVYGPFRSGDVRHSLADISKAARLLGYAPSHSVGQGLEETVRWYVAQSTPNTARRKMEGVRTQDG
jgi:UDP-N-acetylglucosamine 4-epimerase